jgi:hypothetical protein
MAKGKTGESPSQEDTDLMAVVEATDPSLVEPPAPPRQDMTAERITEAPVAPAPPPAPQRQGGGAGAFLGMVLGGVLAAGAGFGLARFMPDLLPMGSANDVSATVAAQAEEIAALRAELAALTAPDPQMEARLSALEAAPSDSAVLEDRLAALEAEIADLRARPAAGGSAASPELQAELAALKEQVAALGSGGSVPADVIAAAEAAEARLKAAEASATAMAEQAEAAAAAARRGAALDRLAAALDSGAPYASALPELGGADLPQVLVDNAAVGLPTVADLADSFPEAARTALEAALRANMGESWTERVSSFLRSQTGLRSLTPREGNDPDAVLSRAEKALAQGRVADTITELAAMPEAGKPALSDWLALAQTRVDAEAAVAALAAN